MFAWRRERMHRAARALPAATTCVLLAALYCARYARISREAAHDTKLILSWVPFFGDQFYDFGEGKQAFERAGCKYTACEITADRLRVPLENFDAILFHGYEFYESVFGVPSHRSQSQLYVFITLESSGRCAIPKEREHFYNYTITYRLDSDAPWFYYEVYDMQGHRVAPSLNPIWSGNVEEDLEIWNVTSKLIKGKEKPIAWFVSNCKSTSGREEYAKKLAEHISLDVYGNCGTLTCSVDNHGECAQMVGEKYYFYLALENSLCSDYVTEKAAWAMIAGAVPVIRSGGDLNRFFPPNSYIEADDDPVVLASKLRQLLESPKEYEGLLRWRSKYKIVLRVNKRYEVGEHPFCALCAQLHSSRPPTPRKESVRRWWMGSDDKPDCRYS